MGYSIVNVDEIEAARPGRRRAVRPARARRRGVRDQLVRAPAETRRATSTTRARRGRRRSTSSSAARASTGSTARRSRSASARSCASTRRRRAVPVAGPDGLTMHRRRRATRQLRAEGTVLEPHRSSSPMRSCRCCAAALHSYLDDFGHERGGRPARDQGADREAADRGRARRVIVRLLLWNLADSKTTLEELRAQLPDPARGRRAGSPTRAHERFGLIAFWPRSADPAAVPRADRQGPRGRRGVRRLEDERLGELRLLASKRSRRYGRGRDSGCRRGSPRRARGRPRRLHEAVAARSRTPRRRRRRPSR